MEESPQHDNDNDDETDDGERVGNEARLRLAVSVYGGRVLSLCLHDVHHMADIFTYI